MIQLKAIPAPPELINEVVEALTQKYKTTGESVWKQAYIKRDLLKLSFAKCCYCECKIDEESKYMEVEHFFPKSLFPDLVVVWENLLPSCKRCNGHKSKHNTQIEPIIHPVRDNPKDYLTLKAYRFYAKNNSLLGKTTIEVIELNDRERLVNKRFAIGTKMLEELEDLLDDLQEFENQSFADTRKERKLKRKLFKLMEECLPKKEYSATSATTLIYSEAYSQSRQIFISLNWWNTEFQEIENQIITLAF